MNLWRKHSYGEAGTGHWSIGNGTLQFDIHPLTVCGIDPGRSYQVVIASESDEYADKIVKALNDCQLQLDNPQPAIDRRNEDIRKKIKGVTP